VANDWEYLASKDAVDATDVVAEVAHLEATLSLELHLMRVPFDETCHQVSMSGKMIDQIWVSRVTYARCSGDLFDECKRHLYHCPIEPCTERVAASSVEVRVELPHNGLHCKAVILCHVSPSLGIQHYPYPRCALIELLCGGSPLDNDPTLVVVTEVSAPNLIPMETGVVIH
jgi:hypothetical protein